VKKFFKRVLMGFGILIAVCVIGGLIVGPDDTESTRYSSVSGIGYTPKKVNRPSFVGGVRPECKIAKWDKYESRTKYEASIHLIISGEYDELGLKMLMRETFEKAERELYPPYGTPKSVWVWAWTEEGFKDRNQPVARIARPALEYQRSPSSSPEVVIFNW